MNGRQILDIAEQASKVETPEITITGIRYKLVACIIGEQYGGNFEVEDQQMEQDLGTFKFNEDGYIDAQEASLARNRFDDLVEQDVIQMDMMTPQLCLSRALLKDRLRSRYFEIMKMNDEPINVEVPVRVTRQWDVTLIGEIRPSELAKVMECGDARSADALLKHFLTQYGYDPLNEQADDLIKQDFDEHDKMEAGLVLMLPPVESLSGEFAPDTAKVNDTIEKLKIQMALRNKNK